MEVKVTDNNIEKAIRNFRKKIEREGILKEVRAHNYYEKPSVKRKRKRIEALRKRKKALRHRRP